MRITGVVLVIFLFVAAVTTQAAAQQPVESCSAQCDPKDPDVNDPRTRTTGPTNVILYAHVPDILGHAPLNVFPPDPAFETDVDRGFLMPAIAAPIPNARFAITAFSAFFCPGPIIAMAEGWYMGCHSGETGVPLRLASPDLTFYLYLSAHAAPQSSSTGGNTVGVVPLLQVDAQIEEIFQPQPTILARTEAPVRFNLLSLPQEPVYEIPVPLQATTTVWPAGNGWHRMLNVSLAQVQSEDASFTQSEWRFHSGPSFPPRLILPVENPLTLETEVLMHDGALYVKALANSPFGGYDVNGSAFRITHVGGPTLPAPTVTKVDVADWNEHDGRSRPAEIVWRYNLTDAAGGEYRFNVSVPNQQGTYLATANTGFAVPTFEGVPVPAAAPLLVFVLLAATAAARRSRGNA